MERWKAFLDSLDTPGGHIFLLSTLAGVLGIAVLCGHKEAIEPARTVLDVVLYAMKGGTSNKP